MKSSAVRLKTLESLSFRPRTEFPPCNVQLAAFASHHRQALADLRALAPKTDYVLELRDSRAPLSSINPLIAQAMPGVPRITLYTKRDDSGSKTMKIAQIHEEGDDFRYISTDVRKYTSRLMRDFKAEFSQRQPQPPLGFRVLVTGMPNAGKSTLINMFRHIAYGKRAKKVARTAPYPGITRAVSEDILLSTDPKIYVIDTPGVLLPKVQNWEHMLKLALIGAVPLKTVDPVVLADYLLYHVNLQYPNGGKYPGKLSNDIMEVLWSIANTMRRRPKRATWDPTQTAIEWVQRYVAGGICKMCLDDMSPENVQNTLQTLAAQQYELSSFLPPSNRARH